jgi:pyrophosphate--fructose-6-phosphate 1-phosphotransferase
MMMNLEHRHGALKPVIKKALVEMDTWPFKSYLKSRDVWAVETCFRVPGSIQYFGPTEVCDEPTITLKLERWGFK